MNASLPAVCLVWCLTLPGCNSVSETPVSEEPQQESLGPPIAITNPEYVVLRPISEKPVGGGELAIVHDETVYYSPAERILDLSHLDARTARLAEDEQGRPSNLVSIETTPEGSRRLREWTSAHLEQRLGIFVGGRLISAPTIKSAIDGAILLDGEFTRAQAEAIVARVRNGGS